MMLPNMASVLNKQCYRVGSVCGSIARAMSPANHRIMPRQADQATVEWRFGLPPLTIHLCSALPPMLSIFGCSGKPKSSKDHGFLATFIAMSAICCRVVKQT